MKIIPNLWAKLNILIPDPKCRTFENDYDLIEWSDSRAMPTAAEVESTIYDIVEITRVKDITDKANTHVVAKYSKLKQDKLMSAVISLKDKRDDLGVMLTSDEEAFLQFVRDVMTWITSVRDIENTAIVNGDLADEVVF